MVLVPKYKNTIVKDSSGRSFASKGERGLFEFLSIQTDLYSQIKCQDHVYLTDARILSIPDFKLWNLKTESWEWAEYKGFETDVWRIKRRLWKHYGPGKLSVYKSNRQGIYLEEELIPV